MSAFGGKADMTIYGMSAFAVVIGGKADIKSAVSYAPWANIVADNASLIRRSGPHRLPNNNLRSRGDCACGYKEDELQGSRFWQISPQTEVYT
jgi:hypothetical protein